MRFFLLQKEPLESNVKHFLCISIEPLFPAKAGYAACGFHELQRDVVGRQYDGV
jgi:hypothetical protein